MSTQQAREAVAAAVAPPKKENEGLRIITQQGSFKGMKQSQIAQALQAWGSNLQMTLPKHLTPDRFIQMATSIIAKNPAIAECSAQSVIGAILQASILGFPPVEALGYCYFVPFNNKKPGGGWVKEIQFQIGYKGFMDLARRSGKIETIHAFVVVEGDEFDYALGLNPTITHKPCGAVAEPDGSNIRFAYAVVKYSDGGFGFEVLPKARIEQLRMRSPMARNGLTGAWKTDYESMAKAKAIKQLAKSMPLTIDAMSTLASDERVIHADNFREGALDIDATEVVATAEADDQQPTAEEQVQQEIERGERQTENNDESTETDLRQ